MNWPRSLTLYFLLAVKRSHQLFLIISLFLIIILGGIVPVAAVDVNSCLNITISGTYVLRNSILNSNTAVCINISSPNVLFEGSGYTIDGMDNSNSKGIYIYNASAALTNITIMNVTLRDWNYGMFVLESQGGRIENATIESTRATTGQGLLLQSVSGYIIINSTIRSNPYGINFTSSNDNAVANTTATANTYGIYLNSSHRNTLTSNNLSSNTNTGLYLVNSNNNTMIATTANSNTNNGCYLSVSANNTLEQSSLRSNPYGINMVSSNNNTVTNTLATANTYGIYLNSSHRNILTSNNLSSNTNTGLYLLGSHDNVITGTTVNRNTNNGCYLSTTMNNTLQNTMANNNAYGMILSLSANISLVTTMVNSNTNTGLQLLSSNTTVARETIANWNSINGVLFTTTTNNSLTQTTALGNQYGVYLTGSSDNTITEIVTSSNSNTGLYLTGSSDNTIIGITANSNANNGVYLTSSPRNTFNNATTMSNQYGFYLTNSNTTIITGVSASSNTNMGIYLSTSNDCTLTDNHANGNTNYGIRLLSSTWNSFVNNTANNNPYGVSLSLSNNNQIINSTVNNNINSGLHLDRSNNNTLNGGVSYGNTYAGVNFATSTNNTILEIDTSRSTYGIYLSTSPNNTLRKIGTYDNTYGIYFTSTSNTSLDEITGQRNTNTAIYLTSSHYNSLNNSVLSDNTNYGIYLYSSREATITNNYLNNSNNLGFGGTRYSNTWNISKSPGTSIVDGPFLGGNFWGKPDWSGFSQVNPDTDGDGICDSSYSLATGNIDYLPLHRPLPVSNFTANVTSGQVPLTVSFNDTSTGAGIGLWYWEFGDGTTSSAPNTTHTYEAPGIYDVRLQVTNDGGSDWENRTGFITVTNQTPVANFTANVTSGPAPLAVSFTDSSTGSGILIWFWDFGDGGVSNAPNPGHLYEIPGTFNVSLFVMNDGGWDWENRTAFVNISPGPVPTPRAYIRISGGGGPTSDIITLFADHIHGGEEYTFDTEGNSPVLSIGISPRETVRDVFLYLERIPSLPESIPDPSPDVYGYFTLRLTGSPYFSLEHAYIDFSVQKVWLSERGITPDEIELDAYRNTGWVSLPLAYLSEHEERVLYRATTRDLPHIFAIMRRAPPALNYGSNSTPLDILSPLPLPDNGGRTGFPVPLNYLYLIVYGAAMFLLGFFYKAWISGKNNSR